MNLKNNTRIVNIIYTYILIYNTIRKRIANIIIILYLKIMIILKTKPIVKIEANYKSFLSIIILLIKFNNIFYFYS